MYKSDTMAAYVADRHPAFAPFDWFGARTVRTVTVRLVK